MDRSFFIRMKGAGQFSSALRLRNQKSIGVL